MVRSIRLRLLDIKIAISDIQEIARELTVETYLADGVRRRAIERLIEIISEASRYLTEEMQAMTPEIPWRAVAAIGNRLRHGYANVSDPTIWTVVEKDLSVMLAAIDRLLAATPKDLPD